MDSNPSVCWFQSPCVSLHLSLMHCSPSTCVCVWLAGLPGHFSISVALRCCFKFHLYNSIWQSGKMENLPPRGCPCQQQWTMWFAKEMHILPNKLAVARESLCWDISQKPQTCWSMSSICTESSQFAADQSLLYIVGPPLFWSETPVSENVGERDPVT